MTVLIRGGHYIITMSTKEHEALRATLPYDVENLVQQAEADPEEFATNAWIKEEEVPS